MTRDSAGGALVGRGGGKRGEATCVWKLDGERRVNNVKSGEITVSGALAFQKGGEGTSAWMMIEEGGGEAERCEQRLECLRVNCT